MHYPIDDLEGLSHAFRVRLARAGVLTTRHLLERGADADGRAQLGRVLGVSVEEVARAVEIADLMRVKGVGHGYALLLQAAGVTSVAALRAADPGALHTRCRTAKHNGAVRRLPTAGAVAGWVADAATLEIVVR